MNQATRTGLAACVLAVFLSSCAVGASAPTAPAPTRAPASTPTSRPTATSTSAPTITPLPTPTPNPSLGTLLLGYRDCYSLGCAVHTARTDLPRSLFELDIAFHSVPAMEGRYLLQDVSPDYKSLLLSAGSSLYVSDLWGNDPNLIATNFVDSLEDTTAFWMRSGSIAFIGYAEVQRYIYLVSSDGSDLRRITDVGMKPGWLVPSANGRGILWGWGWDEGGRAYADGMRWTSLDGSETVRFPDDQYEGSLSPTSATVAYVAERREDELVGGVHPTTRSQALVLFDLDTLTPRDIELPFFSLGSYEVESVAWLPDGQHLLLQLLRFEGWPLPVVIDLQGQITAVFAEGEGTPVIFSPDGSPFMLLFSGLPTIYSMDTGAGQGFNPGLWGGEHLERLVWLPVDAFSAPAPTATPRVTIAPLQETTIPIGPWEVSDCPPSSSKIIVFTEGSQLWPDLETALLYYNSGDSGNVPPGAELTIVQEICYGRSRQWVDEDGQTRTCVSMAQLLENESIEGWFAADFCFSQP